MKQDTHAHLNTRTHTHKRIQIQTNTPFLRDAGGLIMGPQGLHRQHGVHVHDPLHHGNSNGGGMHANMGGGRHGMVARGSPAGGVNRGSGPSLAADSQQQEALLAQQFAGLAATGTAPPPPPPPFHLHSQLSNGSSSSHATAQHGGGRMQVCCRPCPVLIASVVELGRPRQQLKGGG